MYDAAKFKASLATATTLEDGAATNQDSSSSVKDASQPHSTLAATQRKIGVSSCSQDIAANTVPPTPHRLNQVQISCLPCSSICEQLCGIVTNQL